MIRPGGDAPLEHLRIIFFAFFHSKIRLRSISAERMIIIPCPRIKDKI